MDALGEDEDQVEALTRAIAGGPDDPNDPLRDRLSELSLGIREQRELAATHLEAVWSLLPEPIRGERLPGLKAELTRLREVVAIQIEATDPKDLATRRRALVREWCDVFGRTDDFRSVLLDRANILAVTCIGAGGRLLGNSQYDLAIIDEAGRATAPEVLVPLVRARRAILVGDEKQLPPMLDEDLTPQKLQAAGLDADGLDVSLFETMVEDARQNRPELLTMLTAQHRMHPAIGRLISSVFYDGHLHHGVSEEQRNHELESFGRPIVWLSTTPSAVVGEIRRGSSFANPLEVDVIDGVLRDIELEYRKLGRTREVGVIAGYLGQVEELHARLSPSDAERWKAVDLEIATVDAFQGRDRDIVVYSAVRSNANQRIGFLRDRRRLNVALSRARQLLIVVGDVATLERAETRREGNPFRDILAYMRQHPEDCLLRPVLPSMDAKDRR